ncbi:hypothetical protein [[Limnothrix rosea] IAM M-220]|uniref:hypothetical protein n=1 Tax=[Limnothrix rosea] IAM M-220 TaxID=454133 RepID=UPI00095C522A|nr:hypothetical protein [[Limnothrix rosea] IAM M-220]OKH18879.1 hypothetical protein NIES208_03965 [[Limnothrix rosea] IAM M-220]
MFKTVLLIAGYLLIYSTTSALAQEQQQIDSLQVATKVAATKGDSVTGLVRKIIDKFKGDGTRGEEFCFIFPRKKSAMTHSSAPIFRWSTIPESLVIYSLGEEREILKIKDEKILAQRFFIYDPVKYGELTNGEYELRVQLLGNDGESVVEMDSHIFAVKQETDETYDRIPNSLEEAHRLFDGFYERGDFWDANTVALRYLIMKEDFSVWKQEIDQARQLFCED